MNKAQPSGRAFRVFGPFFEKGIIRVQPTSCTFFVMGNREEKTGTRSGRESREVGGKTSKRRGEAVEAAFLAKATRLNFKVCKPWGDSERYDFVVEGATGFWRIQVKLTTCRKGTKYCLSLASDGKPYTSEDIDFLVVYVEPENLWYVLPIEAVESLLGLGLHPGVRRSKYERYREAWCLLKCPPKARGWKDIPVVCRCKKQLPIRCAVCPCRTDTSCGTDTPVRRS